MKLVVCPNCFSLGAKFESKLEEVTHYPVEVLNFPKKYSKVFGFDHTGARIRCRECGSHVLLFNLDSKHRETLAELYTSNLYDFVEFLFKNATEILNSETLSPTDKLVEFVMFRTLKVREKQFGELPLRELLEWKEVGKVYYAACAKCGSPVKIEGKVVSDITSLGRQINHRFEEIKISCSRCGSEEVVFFEGNKPSGRPLKAAIEIENGGYHIKTAPYEGEVNMESTRLRYKIAKTLPKIPREWKESEEVNYDDLPSGLLGSESADLDDDLDDINLKNSSSTKRLATFS